MAINSSDVDNPAPGWPFVNYAQRDRNLNTDSRPLSIPRFKFTYLVEFQINQEVLRNPVTNISEFERNGRIYTHLKTIDYPTANHVYETLRSYNKYIKIPMKAEYPAASMTFDDDSTSIIQTLWKEYEHFYTHAASIGEARAAGVVSNLGSTNEASAFQLSDILVGEEVRQSMDTRPSLGMKLKPNDQRHFFEAITIYDLGTEPQGINVHWFHHPVFTSWEHTALEKEDRTGKVEITVPFEYEGYYFAVGQNRGRIRDFMFRILDFVPPEEVDFIPEGLSGIGRQIPKSQRTEFDPLFGSGGEDFESENVSLTDSEIDDSVIDPENGTRFPVEDPATSFATDEFGTPIPDPNDRDAVARSLESATEERDIISNELDRVENEISNAEQNPNTSDAKLEQLERNRQELEGAKDNATDKVNTARNGLNTIDERAKKVAATQSAAENTFNNSVVTTQSGGESEPSPSIWEAERRARAEQQTQFDLEQNVATQLEREERFRESAQRAADRGDNTIARIQNRAANGAAAKAESFQQQADAQQVNVDKANQGVANTITASRAQQRGPLSQGVRRPITPAPPEE